MRRQRGPTSEDIQRKRDEFVRFYGCEQARGKKRKPVVPRLMEFFGLSRATIQRALAGRPRHGKRTAKPPTVIPDEERIEFSSHLAKAHAQTVSAPHPGVATPAKVPQAVVYGPEHSGRIAPKPQVPADDDGLEEAMREVLLESLDAYLSAVKDPVSPEARAAQACRDLLSKTSSV